MMKKTLLMLAALLLAVGTFTSCKDDDGKDEKDPVDETSIVGVWKSEKYTVSEKVKQRMTPMAEAKIQKKSGQVKSYQIFSAYTKDGYFYRFYTFFDSKDNLVDFEIWYGTYSVEGDNLTEKIGFGQYTYEKTFSIKDNVLTTVQDGQTYTDERATEKEVKKYLDAINPQKKIVGAWKRLGGPVKSSKADVYYDRYTVYEKNGTSSIIFVYYDWEGHSEWVEILKGTWSFDHYMLNEKFKGTNEDYTSFIALGDDFFYNYYSFGDEENFERIDKSDIQKYLDNPEIVYAPAR